MLIVDLCDLFSFLQNFDSDISSVGIDGCWQADSQRLLNEVMVEHFFRQGMLDVAEELCQVSVFGLRGIEQKQGNELVGVFCELHVSVCISDLILLGVFNF